MPQLERPRSHEGLPQEFARLQKLVTQAQSDLRPHLPLPGEIVPSVLAPTLQRESLIIAFDVPRLSAQLGQLMEAGKLSLPDEDLANGWTKTVERRGDNRLVPK